MQGRIDRYMILSERILEFLRGIGSRRVDFYRE